MPVYSVWAYVQDIREDLRPMQERIREGFAILADKISEIPHVESTTAHPESASMTIVTSADVSKDLRGLELGFIEF